MGDVRCRKPAEALARIYNSRGDGDMADEVLQRVMQPPRPPREQQEDNGVSAFDGAIAAVSSTIGSWLTS